MVVLNACVDTDEAAVIALWWGSWHSTREGSPHPRPLADWRQRWFEHVLPENVVVVAKREYVVLGFAAANVAFFSYRKPKDKRALPKVEKTEGSDFEGSCKGAHNRGANDTVAMVLALRSMTSLPPPSAYT